MTENQKLREALQIGREYTAEALAKHDQKYQRHPATEGARKLIADNLAAIEEALALPPEPTGKQVLQVEPLQPVGELPPLPEPHIGLPWRHNAPDGSVHCSAFTREQMHAYALAAIAQAAAPKWLPIETAPKDERDLLLFWGVVRIGSYMPFSGRWNGNSSLFASPDGSPTHWMPLPPAPDGIGQSGGEERKD